ncbi:MAG: HNH endonuclease [Saprospiraceae bacterium]
MKNIKPYDGDSYDFFENVVKSKRNSKKNPKIKERLEILKPSLKIPFSSYDNNCQTKTLELLSPATLSEQEQKDLLELYSYKGKAFQELKIKLTTNKNNRKRYKCQNCTLSEVNSFDHFIPKGEFPEFAVHPKNLVPSCTKCNSKKSTMWRESGKSVFLNLYVNELPKEQFLFVDITVNRIYDIDLNYYLENKNGIEDDLFQLLEHHYNKLNLFQRFKENSDDIITEIENSINSYLKTKLSLKEIIDVIVEKNKEDKIQFGMNYWKSILEFALIHNKDFLARFI